MKFLNLYLKRILLDFFSMFFSIVLTVSFVIFRTCQGHIDPSTLFVTKFIVTYNEALQTCKSRGMKLVQINNAEENAVVNGFASQVIADAYWIDGNDQANEGTWRNSREQDLSYKNFAPNTPDGGVGENCINVFRLPSGFWNDYSCGARIWAICQRDVENQGYSDYLEIEGNELILSNTRLTFAESQEYCTLRNSKLITINSAMDNAVVHSFARETVSDLYWINVNDIDKEGNWVDSDGKPLKYRNFVRGEPAGGRVENCGHGFLNADGLWNDYPCDYKLWAICYKENPRPQTFYPNTLIASFERLTFNEASEYCKAQDLQMVRANSAAENALIHGFARRIIADLYWLDGSDAKTEGRWADSDDNPLVHKGFHPGEPNGGTHENCLNGYLNIDGLWNDFPCNYKNLFAICAFNPLQMPFLEYYELDRRFLMVSSDVYSYNEALQFCRTRGGQLIRINSVEDNSIAAAFAKRVVATYYWIDGNDHTEEGTWMDSNGRNFAVNEPNGARGENCLYSYYMDEGTWRDGPCTNRIRTICSIRPNL